MDDDDIDRLLREAGLELPDVPNASEDDAVPARWDDDDLDGW